MAGTINTPAGEGTINTPAGEGTTQTAPAGQSGKGEFVPITSQEEFDERIKARIARVKATPPADYEDLKAKAARLDELEEASKSELEKATGRAERAAKERDDWKAKYEAMQAAQERAEQVRAMAAQYDVDADMLSRMSGDVEENAKFLHERAEAVPKFGDMHDGGEQMQVTQTLEEALKGARNDQERIRIRAEYKSRNHNR
jgi:hypothetical protein